MGQVESGSALCLDASRGRPGGGRPAWQALAARLARPMSTGLNGFPYQLTTSLCFTSSGSSAASRNSMKPGTRPTSSGRQRRSPPTNVG